MILAPCSFCFLGSILFLDLKVGIHPSALYAKHIRDWLNCEWKRLGRGEVVVKGDRRVDDPFDTDTIVLICPKSKPVCICFVLAALLKILNYFESLLFTIYTQLDNKKMVSIVVSLFAEMHTTYIS